MPSVAKILGFLVAGLAALSSALPAEPMLDKSQLEMYQHMRRQNAAAQASGFTDVEILQFALTLEWLETFFYLEGFALFSVESFLELGLNLRELEALKNVLSSEETHVNTLKAALVGMGVQPVEPCMYDFKFTTPAAMLEVAAVLENVGMSAYLAAGPLLVSKALLSVAASILTVEARHQTIMRVLTRMPLAPDPFDTPLSPLQVFTLVKPFITSCPPGSLLPLTPFPSLTLETPGSMTHHMKTNSTLRLTSTASAKATFCSFTDGQRPDGIDFTPFKDGECNVPEGPRGVVYVSLVSEAPANGTLPDSILVAGPLVLEINSKGGEMRGT